MPVGFTPNAGPIKVPDFKALIAKPVLSSELRRTIEGMQAQIGEMEQPQRRVFTFGPVLRPQSSSLTSSDFVKHTNRYLLLASSSQPSALSDKQDDFDPIYTYDLNGNRISMIDPTGITTYTYDALNRLVEAVNPIPSNPLESFTYDEVGNRKDSNQNGPSTFNDSNHLTEDDIFNYIYDENGNQVQKTNKSTLMSTVFEYDAENKLIRVASLDKTVNYKYDGLGRRIVTIQHSFQLFDEIREAA